MDEEKVVDNAADQASNLEKQALTLGWAPLEDFKGDPEKWADAETFLKRQQLKQQNNKELKSEVDGLKRQMADMQKAAVAAQAKAEQEYETNLKAERARLRDERAEAVAQGDKEAFKAADEALDTLEKAPPPAKPEKTQQSTPEYLEWVKSNGWYESNKSLQLKANLIASDYMDDGMQPGLELMEKVAVDMREQYGKSPKYAALFGIDLSLERAGPAKPGMGGEGPKGGRTVNNLSPTYKATMDRMADEYPESQREAFRKSYMEAAANNPEAWRK